MPVKVGVCACFLKSREIERFSSTHSRGGGEGEKMLHIRMDFGMCCMHCVCVCWMCVQSMETSALMVVTPQVRARVRGNTTQ